MYHIVDREADVTDDSGGESEEDVLENGDEDLPGFVVGTPSVEIIERKKARAWKKNSRLQLTAEERQMVYESQGIQGPVKFDLDHDVDDDDIGRKKGRLRVRDDDDDDIGLPDLDPVPPIETPDDVSVSASAPNTDSFVVGAGSMAHQEDDGFVAYGPGEVAPAHSSSLIDELFGNVEDLMGVFGGQVSQEPEKMEIEPAPEQKKKRTVLYGIEVSDDEDEMEPTGPNQRQAAARAEKPKSKPKKKKKTIIEKQREMILQMDCPERLCGRIKNSDKAQLERRMLKDEAKFILDKGLSNQGLKHHFNVESITQVLKWIREDKMDVPYILLQQRDELPLAYQDTENDLLARALWTIDEYDEKWQQLFLRKKELKQQFDHCQERGSDLDSQLEQIIEYAIDQDELDDVHALMQAYGSSEEKEGLNVPPCPAVTCNEAVGYDSVQIHDGIDKIKSNILAIQTKMQDLQDGFELRNMRQSVKEIHALLEYYTKQRDSGDFEDLEVEAPECTTEAAQEFEGCSLADEGDVEAFFDQMRRRIEQYEGEIQTKDTEKEAVLEELQLLLEHYKKLADLAQSKKFSGLKKPKKSARNHASEFHELKPLIDMVGDVRKLGFHLGLKLESAWVSAAPKNKADVDSVLQEFVINSRYKSVKALKRALIHVMARRIGLEPKIRHQVRKRVFEDATLSTEPTHEGKLRIDWTHPFAVVKRLERKPIRNFLDPNCKQWVLLEDAVKQNLIKPIKYSIKKSRYQRYNNDEKVNDIVIYFMNEMVERFCTRGTSGETQASWDEIRGDILREALTMYLHPMALKCIRKKAMEHSYRTIIQESSVELRNLCNYGYVDARGSTIVSIIVGEIQEPTFVVVLDELGAVVEQMQLHFLKMPVRRNQNSRNEEQKNLLQKKHNDTKIFKNFVRNHKPSFIAIDASGMRSEWFMREVKQALTGLGPDHNPNILLIDPCVSRVYRESEQAEKELESYPKGLRQAVSLGRFCLDPVAEICNIYKFDSLTASHNMLSLPLHPHIRYVPSDKILQGLSKALSQIVCNAGVSLNFMISREWLRGTLQFVAGLGRYRATEIIGQLAQDGLCNSLEDLRYSDENQTGILPESIFMNATAFLMIEKDEDHNRMLEEDVQISFLDGTRIHPDDAIYSELVICNALDKEPEEYELDTSHPEDERRRYKTKCLNDYIHEIREKDQQSIENLNLEAFAAEMEKNQGKKIRHKLLHIKEEVRQYYRKSRKKMEDLSKNPDVLFELLTGESERSLMVGMMLTVKVTKINWAGINCKLDNQLNCWLPHQNLPKKIDEQMRKIEDEFRDNEPQKKAERVKVLEQIVDVGEHITARVTAVDRQRMSVKLSVKEDDMKDQEYRPLGACSYLNFKHPDDKPEKAMDEEARRKDGPIKPFVPRQIDFLHFHNVSKDEAEKMLAEKEDGSIVIRPSKLGLDCLSLSWKMAAEPDIIVHFHIQEHDKPNRYALGRKLEIAKEKYDELDELVAEFVSGMNDKKQQMQTHDKFKFGTEEDIKELLQDEKAEDPSTIPYFLSYSYKEPGRFLLSYIPGSNVQHEYISLVPQGFRFRGAVFQEPSHLIRWFKKHPSRENRLDKKRKKKDRRGRDRDRRRNQAFSSDSSPSAERNSAQSYMSFSSSPNSSGSRDYFWGAPQPPRDRNVVPYRR